MFQHLVVPIDGSTASWSAVPVAARLADAVAGSVTVVTVVNGLEDVASARRELEKGVEQFDDLAVAPCVDVLANDSVASAIATVVEETPGAMVVMSSHGHGRSAAVLGSVADDLLRRTFGPIMVIGPDVAPGVGSVEGTSLVPVDGSDTGESIIPIVEGWVAEFGGVPWVVEVVDPAVRVSPDVMESAYPARLAQRMAKTLNHPIEYDVLHDDDPATGIVSYAERIDASLIFVSTHGRSGLARLRMGSVASRIVHHAPCPVVLYRPPHLVA